MYQIFCEDFIASTQLQPYSVDLIVTSPPYNLDMEYATHDDGAAYEQYLQFSLHWLGKAYNLLKADGRMCLNLPLDKNKSGQQSLYSDVLHLAKVCGFGYHSTIIWAENNISRRTAWGSWLSASAPYVIAPVETIVVLYKSQWKKQNKGQSDVLRDEFIAWTNGLWQFNGESKKRIGHPAPFPRELPRRCIKLFSYVGDVVLDPFMGSGTTLLEAESMGRESIGFDIATEYCELAHERLKS